MTGPVASGPEGANRALVGLGWMVISGLLFVAVNVFVKFTGSRLPTSEAAFLRYLFGVPLLLPAIPAILRAGLDRGMMGLFALRGLVHSVGIFFWFWAMTTIPLAEVTSLNFLVPIYVTAGAALFLRERVALRRILAIGVAFAGALVILRPGFREISAGHIAMLITGVMFAISYLLAKKLSDRASATTVVTMMSLAVTVMLAPVALSVWVMPTAQEAGLLFLTAACATLGHLAMTHAFKQAPVSVTQPATFLQLVWALLLGAVLFGEHIDVFVVLGGTIIVAAITYMALRERSLARRTTPHVVETKS